MILVTKECFLNVKKVIELNVNACTNWVQENDKQVERMTWQVYVYAVHEFNSSHQDTLNVHINAASKEEAYKIYNDLLKQISDSGDVPELNSKLFDEVLKEK